MVYSQKVPEVIGHEKQTFTTPAVDINAALQWAQSLGSHHVPQQKVSSKQVFATSDAQAASHDVSNDAHKILNTLPMTVPERDRLWELVGGGHEEVDEDPNCRPAVFYRMRPMSEVKALFKERRTDFLELTRRLNKSATRAKKKSVHGGHT
eukprot:GHVR01092355.1.p1 GENE.GHVR01092355.1~~GHVR01092355.1.p1  ORF type:complete len:151 (-),score=29.09 GHVR01092355.1:616-1068(-)